MPQDKPSPRAVAAIVEMYRTVGATGALAANAISADVRNELLLLGWVYMDGTNLRLASRGISAVTRTLDRQGRAGA